MFDSEIQSGEKSGEKSDLKHARKTKTTSFTINKANLFELPKLEARSRKQSFVEKINLCNELSN